MLLNCQLCSFLNPQFVDRSLLPPKATGLLGGQRAAAKPQRQKPGSRKSGSVLESYPRIGPLRLNRTAFGRDLKEGLLYRLISFFRFLLLGGFPGRRAPISSLAHNEDVAPNEQQEASKDYDPTDCKQLRLPNFVRTGTSRHPTAVSMAIDSRFLNTRLAF